MRKSKKYQGIADSLNTVKVGLNLKEFSIVTADTIGKNNPDWLLDRIVSQLCYDFRQSNPRFSSILFMKEVYK